MHFFFPTRRAQQRSDTVQPTSSRAKVGAACFEYQRPAAFCYTGRVLATSLSTCPLPPSEPVQKKKDNVQEKELQPYVQQPTHRDSEEVADSQGHIPTVMGAPMAHHPPE